MKGVSSQLRGRQLVQAGALVHRAGRIGPQVLLITSRETQRWVIPKGWPHHGLSLPRSALREAWEEAGVRGRAGNEPLGSFVYDKRNPMAPPVAVAVAVFAVRFVSQDQRWPELGLRERAWFTPAEAARRVDEDGLADILGRFRMEHAFPSARR